ncbi:MBL fold metallo-hydrolase [Candidatus Manganitrophus noduliformans]|uniref:MBL fold metallo-hydrolase n=1 Tax=Candidatus Manganitrophus noduliformans TaxID=2606439 RepID=A0A7X6DLT6_9BACT|nr:MBL fold metallo-hydrolase [Candidatus Manganitrophus noduliformans]NKE69482.1 MBL fold metallo-hydrolase [Candidatus Manganitrophus noduliformans]
MLEDTFSDIIGKARFGKGWSPDELAQKAQMTGARIGALEGGSDPSADEIERLSAALSLDARKLAAIARSEWEPRSREPIPMVRWIDGKIGTYPVNGYLFIDPATGEGALFDTGYSPDQVLAEIKKEKIRLVALCITHTHADHVGGADRIHAATGAPIYLHSDEFSGGGRPPQGITFLKEGGEIPVGRFRIRHRRSPGHTPGGTTFFIEPTNGLEKPVAFVGDALFAGSLGRAQSTSTYPVLLRSVREAILSLPKETRLFPGHGPATTVEEEQQHNPFFTASF